MYLLTCSLFLYTLIGISYWSLADASHDHRSISARQYRRSLSQGSLVLDRVPRANDALDSTGFTFREPVALFRRQAAGSGGQAGGSGSTASSGDYTCGPGRPSGVLTTAAVLQVGVGMHPILVGLVVSQIAMQKQSAAKHGFCGTTSDFCGDGCQSKCKQPKPDVGSSNSRQVVIGYYEGWNMKKKCGTMTPEEIPVHSLTHLIFSFGFIAPGTFKIEPMTDFQPSLFGRVTDLKMKKPSLKVLIALGGWTHNDPGKYQKVFSDMAASAANRKTFISNLIGFMAEYGFDGVDLDWEYPGAPDRGGIPEDGDNLNKLMKEMKDAMGSRYILTFTAPTSYWYLRHFDIKKSAEIADWINLMSYDLHGVWDGDNPIGNQILGHTNLTEIDLALDLLWRNDVSPSKIVLGTGFYGRSFRLEDPKCWTPGCKFSGPGEKGECTDTEGFLSYKEVKDILAKTKAKPKLDKKAAVQYLTYGQNSWISYDDPTTIQLKVDFANKRGLKGLMTWAIDIDDEKGDLIRALTGSELKEGEDLLQFMTDNGPSIAHSTADGTKCKITECGSKGVEPKCETGYTVVGRVSTDINGKNRCNTKNSKEARKICCPSFSGPQENDCRWDDSHSSSSQYDCSAKCKVGEINVINDSLGWKGDVKDGSYDWQCGRGWKSFCCKAGNMERYLKICSWTGCDEKCPSDKPHQLTTDTGGPKANERCGWDSAGDPFSGEGRGIRRLCCPRENSFGNCNWEGSKVCSSTCPLGKITLDLDPRGPDPRTSSCHNGREQAFCCEPIGGFDRPFTPFNLENLFPESLLPPADAIPNYDLVSFGPLHGLTKEQDPDKTGIAFFLIAGHSSAVSSMRKRDNPGLEFIDCPHDILDRPNHEIQTARIVCMHQNVTDCFRVEENGVEGTIVHMPDECGGPSWSRAISLTPSLDQSLPGKVARRGPTSVVYDFKFDYNIGLVRRDAGRLSIRLDYSNVPGYWYAVVDTGGSQKRDLKSLVDRFFDNGNTEAWYNRFNQLEFFPGNSVKITEKLDRLVYHNGQACSYEEKPVDEQGKLGESISIAMQGNSSIELHYGFSMIATWTPGASFKVHQAAGFVRPQGKTDVSFRLGGEGTLDTSKSLVGSTISKKFGEMGVSGHSIYKGWAFFTAYKESSVDLASGDNVVGAVSFSGYAESRIQSNWGRYNVHFPSGATTTQNTGTGEGQRLGDEVSKSSNNKLNALSKSKGWIEVGATVRVGLTVGMSFSKPYDKVVGDLPDMSVSQRVFSRWNLEHTGTESCVSTSLGTKMRSHLTKGSTAWNTAKSDKLYVDELAAAGTKQCFKDNGQPIKKRDLEIAQNLTKRVGFDDGRPDLGEIPTAGHNLGDSMFNQMLPIMPCDACGSCTLRNPFKEPCCGCVCLGCKYGLGPRGRDEGPLGPYGDNSDSIFSMPILKRDLSEEGMLNETERSLEQLDKRAGTKPNPVDKPCTVCGATEKVSYPGFPNFRKFPNSPVDFDLHQPLVMKYYHNSSSACTSWAVRRHVSIDMIYDSSVSAGSIVGRRKGFYQTEHPFEAQSISKFLDGHLTNIINRKRRDCAWVRKNLIQNRTPWNNAGGSVFQLMMRELGTRDTPGRLAVFMARSNRMKGSLSGWDTAANTATFDNLQAGDEQLMYVKEFGMVFAYWNLPEIWNSYCDSYNGMRDVLAEFDRNWNLAHANDPSDLMTQWETWNRNNLKTIALNGRMQALSLYNRRKQIGGLYGAWWSAKWWLVFSAPLGQSQYAYIALDRTCRNLQ
ncbi:hypothetical protein OPT61_g7002 [Boeremia exigua]|uniref:Uncharacterized protein n=1 Tax=Boeremia exigua TaxID=749465 RepID=A0ACC2I4H8_9PLEO|nr:hypothetical protein OPT61_g7002 [Boeremia exigua]